MPEPIRVLLVEDSPVVLLILQRLLSTDPEIKVVGVARNGLQALESIPSLQPTVICTDFHMPEMNGLEFTQQVMRQFPLPILVISTSVHPRENETNVFRLLEAGAVDIFTKPKVGSASDYEQLRGDLIGKIKVLAGVKVFTRHQRVSGEKGLREVRSHQPVPPTSYSDRSSSVIQAIAIGASTGGPQALHTLLTRLPTNLSVPVFCVQHISEGFLQGLVQWLDSECSLPVKIARADELPLPGVIYFAPERFHLELGGNGRIVCSSNIPVDGHCPSVSALFRSAARRYGRGLMGIQLTGMGKDGASGMMDIALAGGMTIAQDEQSSIVFGMPKEAISLGAVKHVLPIDAIPDFLKRAIPHTPTRNLS